MRLRLTVAILFSVFIRRYVDSQKTTSHYEYDESEIHALNLHLEIEGVRQMISVQERQLLEMRMLLEAVHQFMDQLLTNYSMNDCFQSQPMRRNSHLTSGKGQCYHQCSFQWERAVPTPFLPRLCLLAYFIWILHGYAIRM